MFPQSLTNQVGEKQVVNLLSHPSDGGKRNDHGHEVLGKERELVSSEQQITKGNSAVC